MDDAESALDLFFDGELDDFGPSLAAGPRVAEPIAEVVVVDDGPGWVFSDDEAAVPSQQELWDTDSDKDCLDSRPSLVHDVLLQLQPKPETRGRKRKTRDIVSEVLSLLGEPLHSNVAASQECLVCVPNSEGGGSSDAFVASFDMDQFMVLRPLQRFGAVVCGVSPSGREITRLTMNRSHLASIAEIGADRVPEFAMVFCLDSFVD